MNPEILELINRAKGLIDPSVYRSVETEFFYASPVVNFSEHAVIPQVLVNLYNPSREEFVEAQRQYKNAAFVIHSHENNMTCSRPSLCAYLPYDPLSQPCTATGSTGEVSPTAYSIPLYGYREPRFLKPLEGYPPNIIQKYNKQWSYLYE